MEILTLKNVVKRYEGKTAVDHVSFSIPEGSIFGLLGPNGAGKTSLIRIITTIIGADEGEVHFLGKPLAIEHPAMIGYMPEERGLYKKMKVGEQLVYLAALKGLHEKDAIIELKKWFGKFQIENWWNKKVEELSKGMQQKVQFISTVVHKPKLLILDEPFSGLDPINTNLIKDEIDELHRKGTSIIFSTHRMEQVEEICDEIVLINHGRIILQGNVQEIKQSYKMNVFRFQFAEEPRPEALAGLEIISHNAKEILLKNPYSTTQELLRRFLDQNVSLTGFTEVLPDLNEIFIRCVEASNTEQNR